MVGTDISHTTWYYCGTYPIALNVHYRAVYNATERHSVMAILARL